MMVPSKLFEIEELELLAKEKSWQSCWVRSSFVLGIKDEAELTPLEDVVYAPFNEQPLVLFDIPEVDMMKVDVDDDLLFLKEVRSGSCESRCIPLALCDLVPPPPCSPYALANSLFLQPRAEVCPFMPIPKWTFVVEAFSSSSLYVSIIKTPWRSSFGWIMEDV